MAHQQSQTAQKSTQHCVLQQSQKTAAKVLDVIARLLGCVRQASDVVSGYTQVKVKDAPAMLQLPQSEFLEIWIRLPRCTWPNFVTMLKKRWFQ